MIPHSKPTIDNKEIRAACKVLKSGFLSQGKSVKNLELAFSNYIGRRFAVATNSGTSALHLALLALRIGSGDEVIVPSFVCAAVLNAVNYLGASPKVVDINIEDFNISIDSVKKNISKRTKVIIAPHMFGVSAEIDRLLDLGIPIIEDCALSVGATYKGKPVGSFGGISIFSFYSTKMLMTAEGGMLLTNNRKYYDYALDRRDYDNKQSYKIRYNYKMNDLAAALGIAQLNKLSQFISRRQDIAKLYNIGLNNLKIQIPYPMRGKTHVYFRYIIRTKKNANTIINRLKEFGIEAKRPIYKPLHKYLNLSDKDFPATTQVYRTAVSLPIYPTLKDSEAKFIINKIKSVLL